MFEVKTFERKTLSWWETQRDELDLSPSYQRKGGLWTATDKAFLIDSIINGYDIPKIYIADFTYGGNKLNEKGLKYSVIDGKQRFEAIFDFFDGNIVLDNKFKYTKNKNLKLGGLSYKDLKFNHPKICAIFETYNLAVMSVITDESEKINELFVRLNRNKPLTGAEIRNAMVGPLPLAFREIAKHEFFTNRIRFSTKRGQDLNLAAKLFLLEIRGKLVSTKKINLDQIVEDCNDWNTAQVTDYVCKILNCLNAMRDIFVPNDELLRSEGPVTVYYWLVREVGFSSQMRPFLLQFNEELKSVAPFTKNISKDAIPELVPSEMLEYALYNRSTNDQGSLERRFDILKRRFEQYLFMS